MSVVIVIDEKLRAKVAKEIRQMSHSHPRASLAAEILPQHFNTVVDGVAELIDLEATEDFEIATILALSKWKARNLCHFIRHKKNPLAFSIWKK